MADIAALSNYYRDIWTIYDKRGFSRQATPTAKMMKEDGNLFMEGRQAHIVLPTTQDFSYSYDITQAVDGAAQPDNWVLPSPIGVHGAIEVAGDVMMRPNAAVINVIDQRIEYGMQTFHEARERRLWDDGSGSLGTVGAITGTTTVTTPIDQDTYYRLPPNAVVVFNPTRTGSVGTIRANTYQVTGKVLNNDGTAQATFTRLTGSTVPVNGDYIFVNGTYGQAPSGILGFLPETSPDPATDSFLSVNRGHFPNLLSGWRFGYQGTIEETLIQAMSKFGRFVAQELVSDRFTVCLSAGDWARLAIEMMGRLIVLPDSYRRFGAQALGVLIPYGIGMVPVITIPAIPDNAHNGYLINWDSWHNAPVGTVPHIMQDDGLVFARVAGKDASAMRLRAYDQTFCHSPVTNGQFKTA